MTAIKNCKPFSGTAVWLIATACVILLGALAQAQTYRVLHQFTGGSDGADPVSTLAIDRAGNLYGTATLGGTANSGTVFKLTHYGAAWIFNPIYQFHGTSDGGDPAGAITIGNDGELYGTAAEGGSFDGGDCAYVGCGVVYRLRPPATSPPSPFTPWSETVLHTFVDSIHDGFQPASNVIFDAAGNLYGTTVFGGTGGQGTVYRLAPSNGNWNESILFNFGDPAYGQQPAAGVWMDAAGNLYGTTPEGGEQNGLVYELNALNGWQQSILHAFDGDNGSLIYAGLVADSQGNLYGAAYGGHGVIFELSPSPQGWTFQVIYRLGDANIGGPFSSLTIDAQGNLYGAADGFGANGVGMVFKLTNSDGVWTLTDLHDFDFGSEYFPRGGVTMDAAGNLYGTTTSGVHGRGVVWEITP